MAALIISIYCKFTLLLRCMTVKTRMWYYTILKSEWDFSGFWWIWNVRVACSFKLNRNVPVIIMLTQILLIRHPCIGLYLQQLQLPWTDSAHWSDNITNVYTSPLCVLDAGEHRSRSKRRLNRVSGILSRRFSRESLYDMPEQ